MYIQSIGLSSCSESSAQSAEMMGLIVTRFWRVSFAKPANGSVPDAEAREAE